MFNVGIGEILVILLACLVVFGPDPGLPRPARGGGWAPAEPARPGVGSLRGQARDYLGELVDIDEQMAESQRERQRLRCSCRRGAGTSAVRP